MTPNPQEREDKDKQIAELAERLAREKAATQEVVKDLRVQLRYNRVVTRAVQNAESGPTILLPGPK